MRAYHEFIKDVQKGYNGEICNIPLTSGPYSDTLSRLGTRVSISKGMYTLFGGMSGSGKTAVVDSMFLLNIYLWWKRNRENTSIKIYWIYRSMERNIKYKVAKWTAYLMYIEHGILIDVPTIFQWSNKLYDLDDALLTIIKSYDKFFEEFFDYVDLKHGAENPTGVRNYGLSVAYQKGKYIKANSESIFINNEKQCEFNEDQFDIVIGKKSLYKDLKIYGKVYRIHQYENLYVPQNDDEFVFHITDHLGKLTSEKGFTDKQIIDKHAEYQGIFRDDFMWNPIDVMQFNRGLEDTYRQVKTDLDVTPADFKSSGDPYENADLAFGLLNPYKLKQFNYDGYDIMNCISSRGNNRFRGLKCIKNSYGADDFRLGYGFLGENGFMKELPLSEDMKPGHYESIKQAKFI
jgi:hypothetical protein